MDFGIDKAYFGTPFYLIVRDDGSVEKKNEIKDEDIIMVGSLEAWVISKLYGFAIPRFPPAKYRRSFFGMGLGHLTESQIPWEHVIPRRAYKEEVKKIISALREGFKKLEEDSDGLSYYKTYFKRQNEIFGDLKPAKIDEGFFIKLLSSASGDPALKSFTPSNGGFAQPLKYDRLAIRTGRLKIRKGPAILHLKKEYRGIIARSRFGEKGSVYQLDYPSLEPRVLLSITSRDRANIPRDIYQDIIDKFNLEGISRDIIKRATISRIYGAVDETIEQQLINAGVGYPRDLIGLMDEYFGVGEIRRKLASEFFKNDGKRVKNFYGRPVRCDETPLYVLLNYFIQSTAADVALLGFNQINSKIKQAGIQEGVIPIFILHDALFLDVHQDYEYLLPKLCKAGSRNIPKFEDIDFYLGFEKEGRKSV
jgi:hypothetical protein